MNFSRRFSRPTRPPALNSDGLAILVKIRDCVPYLEKRRKILQKDKRCFNKEDLSQINYWLEIAKDVKADLTYDMDTLEVTYSQIAEMARKCPNKGDSDDDENEPDEEDEEDEDEILGLAEKMKQPSAPPLIPPGGILIPAGRGRGSRGANHTSGLTQSPPETQPGLSPGFIKIITGYSVGRGRGSRIENPAPQPGPNSSNIHDNNSMPRHTEHHNDQRSKSESMEFQSKAPDELSRRSQNLTRSPLTQMEYSDRRVIDYGHQDPADSKANDASFNENCAPDSRFSPACDTLNGSSKFGPSVNMAQGPSLQFQRQAYVPQHPGPSFPQTNSQNPQFNHQIRPPRPFSNPHGSLLGNPGPSVFSNPRVPHFFQNTRAPDLPLPRGPQPHLANHPRGLQPNLANPPLIPQAPPLMSHMPPSSTWIPNRHQNQNNFNPNQRGFGPRKPSHLSRPHSNPNTRGRGALQPQTRIQERFANISRADVSKNQTQNQEQRPPAGNLQPASSSSSQAPDTNNINWRSRFQDYFSQQDKRPVNGIRLTNAHQVRHRGRGRGNSRGGPATRGRRPAPPTQAKNLPINSNEPNDQDSNEKSTSPPSAKKRQAAIQTAEDRAKSQILNRVRANLDRELPQRSKESKLAQMRKEFAQNEVYKLGFKNKDNTIQKGPVEKLPEPADEDSPVKSVSRSRSRSVTRARSRSKSVARGSRSQSGSLSPKKRPARRVNFDEEEDAENQEDRSQNEANEEDTEDRGDEENCYEDGEDDTEIQGANSDMTEMAENEEQSRSKVPQVSDESHFLSLARNLLVETGVSDEDIEKVLSNPNQKKEILAAIQEALTRPANDVTSNGQQSVVSNVDMAQPPRPESTSSSAASTLSESSSADSTSSKKRKKDDNSNRNDMTEDAPSPPPKSPPPKKRPTQSTAPKTKPKKSKVTSGRVEIAVLKAPELPIHVGMTKIKVEQDYFAEQRIKQEPVHRDQICDDSD